MYDPEEGYYTKNIRTVGKTGDFSTSATLGGELGGAIAVWIREEWRRAGRKLPVIEIGPGDGSLHHTVLKALGFGGRWGLRVLAGGALAGPAGGAAAKAAGQGREGGVA